MSVEGLPVTGNAGAVRGVEMNTPKPRTWLAIDFETYYDAKYSVAALGYSAYCADKRFAATLVAISDGETSEACHPSAFDWTKIADKELVAHNAAFDKAVFAALQQHGIIPAGIKPVAWHCTADMCAYFGVPRSLAQAAEVLLGVKLDKSVRDAMKGGGDLFTSPDKFTEYAAADAKACAMLWAKFSKWWPEDERELSDLTRRMGERGLYLDRSKTTDIFQGLEDTIESAKMTLPWKGPATSPKAIEAHCKAHGIEPPANTNAKGEELEEWLEKHGDTPPARAIKAVQEIRSLNRSAKVLETMLERIRPDGRIDAHTMYFGAATGRWSGGGHGLNLQNLNRGDAGTADIRGCITAAPGHKLLIMDLSQIEPRCLAWAAGDRAWLDLVRSGMNPYEAHGMTAHGWKGKKLKQENPRLYALCKAERLGLGYGCGADKFVLVAKLLGGLEVTPAESKKIVSEFRASNQCIVKFWDSLEAAFTARDGQDYRMPLPSGRRLRYADVKVEDMTASVLKGGPRTKLYGGKLCLAAGTLVLTRRGWIAIQTVDATDEVWDGCEWVKQSGPVFNGNALVIKAHGVYMTPDHKVLTTEGWKDASSCEKYQRADCRIPEGYETAWERLRSDMGGGLRMREDRADEDEGIYQHEKTRGRSVLRMSAPGHDIAAAIQTQNGSSSCVCSVAVDDSTLHFAVTQGMEKLRRSWDNGVRSVARMLREFLGRHGRFIPIWLDFGPDRQHGRLPQRKLCVENVGASGEQQTVISDDTNTARRNDCGKGGRCLQNESHHALLPFGPRVESIGCDFYTDCEVYDLVNCGPRNRFTVATPTGPLIVHNCENFVQAMARDVFAEGLARAEYAGLNPILTVHDEIICEVPEEKANAGLDLLRLAMCHPPIWAPDLPVAAEGEISDHYKK